MSLELPLSCFRTVMLETLEISVTYEIKTQFARLQPESRFCHVFLRPHRDRLANRFKWIGSAGLAVCVSSKKMLIQNEML